MIIFSTEDVKLMTVRCIEVPWVAQQTHMDEAECFEFLQEMDS